MKPGVQPKQLRANIYVDGFNLYYGALKNTPYKSLDLDTLFRTSLPGYDIHRIRYSQPASPAAQGTRKDRRGRPLTSGRSALFRT